MYKYRYADLDCDYCVYREQCQFELCYYIIEFLDELELDEAFHEAVENADACKTNHRQTLVMLKNQSAKEENNG